MWKILVLRKTQYRSQVPFSTCTPAQIRVTVSTDITVRGGATHKATSLPAHLSEFEFTAGESVRLQSHTDVVVLKCNKDYGAEQCKHPDQDL